nr:hypothetical protein CFP56_30699 [Quercus suber]
MTYDQHVYDCLQASSSHAVACIPLWLAMAISINSAKHYYLALHCGSGPRPIPAITALAASYSASRLLSSTVSRLYRPVPATSLVARRRNYQRTIGVLTDSI